MAKSSRRTTTTQRNNSTADAAAMLARANSSQTERKKRHVIKKDELLAVMILRSGLFMKKTEYRKTAGLPLIADLLGLGRSDLKKAVAREDSALAEQIANPEPTGAVAAEEGPVPMLVTQADEGTEQRCREWRQRSEFERQHQK